MNRPSQLLEMASRYESAGQHERAETLYREAVAAIEDSTGPVSTELASANTILPDCYASKRSMRKRKLFFGKQCRYWNKPRGRTRQTWPTS